MKLKAKTKKAVRSKYYYDPRTDGVSQSILEGWLNCRQLAYLRTVCGLTPHDASRPLIHGSISHGAIKLALRRVMNEPAGMTVADLQRAVPKDVASSLSSWRLTPENANASTASLDIAEESAAFLAAILPSYWGHWGKKDLVRKWVKVEDRFKVPIKIFGTASDMTIPLVGQFDGVFENNGRPCLLETKNKSRWSEMLSDLLPLDLQVGVYLTALSATEKADPSLVIYNILRRPGERRGKNETLSGLAQRIGENARRDPDHYFTRFEVELTRQEKDRHKARVRELLKAFYLWWMEVTTGGVEVQPPLAPFGDLRWNSSHCENKYGTCEFLRVCGREDYSGFYRRQAAHPELA